VQLLSGNLGKSIRSACLASLPIQKGMAKNFSRAWLNSQTAMRFFYFDAAFRGLRDSIAHAQWQ
jgi:hypothetical protein